MMCQRLIGHRPKITLILLLWVMMVGCQRFETPPTVQLPRDQQPQGSNTSAGKTSPQPQGTSAPSTSSAPAPSPTRPIQSINVANFEGTLELRQGLTFYVVNDGGNDFTINMKWHDPQQINADRPRLVRVFDPAEHIILRHDEPGTRVNATPPNYNINLPIKANGSGVYQVIVTGFGGSLDFATQPPLSWGVLGYPRLVGRSDQFSNAYIYLPPGLDSMPIRTEGTLDELQLFDESGASKMLIRGTGGGAAATLPKTGEHVWKLSIKSRGEYRLDFSGLPIILCSDPHTARAIRASVDVLEDGTICFHKFQIKAQEIVNRYRQLPQGVLALSPPQLNQYRDRWLAESARNDLLLGGAGVYAAMPSVLQSQNVDVRSPLFGAMVPAGPGNARKRQPANANPWTSYTRNGLVRVADHAAILAAVYSINQPFNPLHKNQVLRHRVILAAMQELMLLREHELPMDISADNYFGGDRAFVFASFVRSFPLVAADCPDDVKAVWTEGLRRYTDRESISQVATAVNQWTFLIRGFQHMRDGTGDTIDDAIVQRHVGWLLERNQWDVGYMPAGYFYEVGPDATYAGISLHNLAYVYEQSKDPALREALRRCIDLFNHTIAPQPDGRLLGATSFATRTPGNWSEMQHGGGLAMLADDFGEATPLADRVWPTTRPLPRDLATRRIADEALTGRLNYLASSAMQDDGSAGTMLSGPEIHFSIWQHFATLPRAGDFPMRADRDFTRNFGDEFFCVRRPRYYAFIHSGQPLPEWKKGERPADPRGQHPRNGGGLCMFWSPAFGSSLLAQNWSAYAANTIIAEHATGNGADWEDYWSVKSQMDADNATATITGSVRNQPLNFQRKYRFERDRLVCDILLTANAAAKFKAMWECFPYPAEPSLNLQATLTDEHGNLVRNRPASAIVFRNGSPEAHVIVFASPRMCDVGTDRSVDHYKKSRDYGRVLAELPADWAKGQQSSVSWCMIAVPVDQIAQSIGEAVAAMNR